MGSPVRTLQTSSRSTYLLNEGASELREVSAQRALARSFLSVNVSLFSENIIRYGGGVHFERASEKRNQEQPGLGNEENHAAC